MTVWEFVLPNGEGVISGWPLDEAQLGRLHAKFTLLRAAEVDPRTRQVNLPQNLLAGPGIGGYKWLYKLKVRGNVQLRPFLCLGPPAMRPEWTALARATERDRKLVPSGVAEVAEDRRLSLEAQRAVRRPIEPET